MGEQLDPAQICPLVGSSVDQYDVTGLLGYGAMGCVYRVRHQVLGKEYALKMLSSDRIQSDIGLKRFHREAFAAAQIDHPNVVRVVYSGKTQDGQTYLVMELLHGEPLSTLTARGKMAPLRAVEIARQVAVGLEEIHRLGFVHRDIKPSNLLVSSTDGKVKILDLGLIGMTEPDASELKLTKQGHLMGTPLYMAPEAFTGEGTDQRGDLYALGCVLYEMLAGVPPFIGTMKEIMWAHNFTEPPPLPPSQGVEALVLALLAKDPDARPTTAREVILWIDRILDPEPEIEPEQALVTGVPDAIVVPARPRWPAAAFVIGAAMIAGVLLTYARAKESSAGVVAVSAPDPKPAPAHVEPEASPTPSVPAAIPHETPSSAPIAPTASAQIAPTVAPRPRVEQPTGPREVMITSTPPGASVQMRGGIVGMTPISVMIESGKSTTLTLHLDGHPDQPVVIAPRDRSPTHHVQFR